MKKSGPQPENDNMVQDLASVCESPVNELKSFLEVCKEVGQYKGKKFDKEVIEHLRNTSAWKTTLYDTQCRVAKTPLLVILGNYANGCIKGVPEAQVRIKLLEQLVQNIEVFRSNPKIYDVKQLTMVNILDLIRCQRRWSYEQREAVVNEFLQFWAYLNLESVGYIEPPYDPLKKKYDKKDLSFKKFIQIADTISLRERTIAELLYFGEDVTLNDVFTLDIKNVDFKESLVHFFTFTEHYPQHVMQNLKDIIDKRKKGPVFLGKSGKAIDPTVPYRALKNAVYALDLNPSFSFKNFTETR